MEPIVEKAMSLYGEIKITDKCTFSECTNKKKKSLKNLCQYR
jgi:hypothetical protein